MSLPPPVRGKGPTVAVIGAGVVGACCADALARGGAMATIIEADAEGPARRSASVAAAGMLGAFSEILHEGPGHHRRMSELSALALKAWRALAAQDEALKRTVRFPGALLLAHDDADGARVRRAAERAKANGARAEFFEGLPLNLDGVLYGARVKACARLPDEGAVAPRETLARIIERAVSAGASLLRGRAVMEAELDAGRWSLTLDSGERLRFDAVVLASGALHGTAFTSLAPALSKLLSAKGMIGSTPLPPGLNIPDVIRTPRVYLLREDKTIRFGATSEIGRTDLDPDPDALAALYLEMRRVLPGAKFAAAPSHASAGLRPLSPDGGPLVGPAGRPGLFMASGHGRNGWLLGPVTGEAIAAHVLGGEPAAIWQAFRPDRFG